MTTVELGKFFSMGCFSFSIENISDQVNHVFDHKHTITLNYSHSSFFPIQLYQLNLQRLIQDLDHFCRSQTITLG